MNQFLEEKNLGKIFCCCKFWNIPDKILWFHPGSKIGTLWKTKLLIPPGPKIAHPPYAQTCSDCTVASGVFLVWQFKLNPLVLPFQTNFNWMIQISIKF